MLKDPKINRPICPICRPCLILLWHARVRGQGLGSKQSEVASAALRKCVDLCGAVSSRSDSAVYQGTTSVVLPERPSTEGLEPLQQAPAAEAGFFWLSVSVRLKSCPDTERVPPEGW
jgi:hypothetical protein